LFLVTFIDFYTGLYGLVAVLTANVTAMLLGLDREQIRQGYYGFNALLTGMGLGVYFQPGALLMFIVIVAGILALFAAVALQGIIGKYGLPHLSLPFIFTLWTLMLAGREFTTIGLNERGIYMLNDLYLLGGKPLLHLYEWWNSLYIPAIFRTYLLSLAAIFFHYNLLAGVLIFIGLLLYSRIAFTLSLLGFFTAWLFYQIIGVELTETGYSYIGFNFILTSIAAGGFFIVPSRLSYLWVLLLIPIVSLITLSLGKALGVFGLPVYSLPFNIVILGFLYVLHFRVKPSLGLINYFVQYNAPEKNLYAYKTHYNRFGNLNKVPLYLPFHGEWIVTQGWDGTYTHKGAWKYAWDFEMDDEEGKTYRNAGDYPQDYYCYDKVVLSPADGIVEEVFDGIEDNIVGEKNLEHNWGNTVIIYHAVGLYSKLSHLKQGSIVVKPGDRLKKGQR
jgi:urea transporter